MLVWEGKGSIIRQAKHPLIIRTGAAKMIQSQHLSRNAVVRGSRDDQDISGTMVGASLQMTLKTISR